MPGPRKSPLPSPLAECIALVRRADVHLKALDRTFERFFDRDPYGIETYIDAEPVEEAIARLPSGKWRWRAVEAGPAAPREIVLVGRVRRAPPSIRAGLLIGDAVNNLRAALDHAVWLLSIANAIPPDPIPRGKQPGHEWRDVGWPIVIAPTAWTPTAAMRLRFVDRAVRAEIERLQPFSRRQQEPERDEFAVLDELWNVYKHRHLPLTQLWIGLDKVLSRLNRVEVFDMPPGYADDLRKYLREHAFVVSSGGTPRHFEDGAELGRVREARPPYSWIPEMHVDARLAADIAFHEGPPAWGIPVQSTLRLIRDEVLAALKAIEPFL